MKKKMLAMAITTAALAHGRQFDKGGNPYILHPLAVMHILNSDDEELQCIAILHDVLEDCDEIDIHDLRADGYSERILCAVDALTKKDGQSYDDYLEGVLQNQDAIRVKMADITHNSDFRRLKGVTDKDLARLSKYAKAYDKLKAALV